MDIHPPAWRGAASRVVGVGAVGAATRDYRAHLMHELMDRDQLDALAFMSPTNFKFATNFSVDVSVDERPVICVIPRNGAPFVILHEISACNWRFATEAQRVWVSSASFYSEHPRVKERLPLAFQWDELLASRLEALGLQRARIGTDGSLLSGVTRLLPRLQGESIARQCQRLRLVRHAEELAVMREAAALADWTQDRYRENIRPGRLVAELDMSMASLMAQEAARRMPGSEITLACWTLSGPVSASAHGAGSAFGNLAGAIIETGDVLVNCVYPAVDGLWVENERTWFCGKPSKRQAQLFEIARAANAAACEVVISGRPVWSIDAAAQDVFERAGVAELVCHRTGHGLGVRCHDFPQDMAFNDSLLQDGMVFSVEPGIYEYGLGGFRIDDTVVAGRAPESLTASAKDLASQTIS